MSNDRPMRRHYALDEAGELKFTQALVTWQYEEIERLQSVASSEMKLREGNFAEIERLEKRLAELQQYHDWAAPQIANQPSLPDKPADSAPNIPECVEDVPRDR